MLDDHVKQLFRQHLKLDPDAYVDISNDFSSLRFISSDGYRAMPADEYFMVRGQEHYLLSRKLVVMEGYPYGLVATPFLVTQSIADLADDEGGFIYSLTLQFPPFPKGADMHKATESFMERYTDSFLPWGERRGLQLARSHLEVTAAIIRGDLLDERCAQDILRREEERKGIYRRKP